MMVPATCALAREELLRRIVDLAIERHRMESILVGDPVRNGYFARPHRYLEVMDRLHRLLMGDDAGSEAHGPAAMLVAAMGEPCRAGVVGQLEGALKEGRSPSRRRHLRVAG